MEFDVVLKRMRKRAGLSQEEMSEKLHIARSSISKLERGRLELKAIDLVNWANVTNSMDLLIAFMGGIDVTLVQQMLETGVKMVGFFYKLGGII